MATKKINRAHTLRAIRILNKIRYDKSSKWWSEYIDILEDLKSLYSKMDNN